MPTKECVMCNEDFIPIAKNGKICSDECRKIKKREYQQKWRDNNKQQTQAYRERTKGRMKEWRKANREHLRESHQKWVNENKESHLARGQKWREVNRGKLRKQYKEYYHANKNDPNKSIMKGKARQIELQRLSRQDPNSWWNAPMRKLHSRISVQLRRSFNFSSMRKDNKTFNILNFTKKELYNHLESQFTDGMSWNNMNEWHIDHIRPVASFNFTTTECEDFKKCWALSNLQPLWAEDNLSKNDKWDGIINA